MIVLPMRCSLLRGSNVYQRSPMYTSIQAQKSIGDPGVGYSDVGQVAEDVTGGDVQRPTRRNGKVGEVSTHAVAVAEHIDGGGCWQSNAVVETGVIVNPLRDGLHPVHAVHSRKHCAELFEGERGQLIRLAVPARYEKRQSLVRQVGWVEFPSEIIAIVGGPRTVDRCRELQCNRSGRERQPATAVSEQIEIRGRWNARVGEELRIADSGFFFEMGLDDNNRVSWLGDDEFETTTDRNLHLPTISHLG